MAKSSCHVRSWELGPLKSFLPCDCYEYPSKENSYNVRFGTSSSYVYGDGPTITNLYIMCNNCNAEYRGDISAYGILEKDVNI